MASRRPDRETKRYFTVEEANRRLPLVSRVVADIVRQLEQVQELERRLAVVDRRPSRSPAGAEPDAYGEEVAASRAELEVEKRTLREYVEELNALGVELKGPDGLCDFPSLRDGREVCLCWRLGEPEVAHWHEVKAGFAGRQPIEPGDHAFAGAGGGQASR